MFRFRRPSDETLDSVLAAARAAEPSYPDVGVTQHGLALGPYKLDRYWVTLGPASVFERAAQGLREWATHKGAGLGVLPEEPVEAGATHLVVIRVGAISVLAPVRIVYVVDEPDRFGWAYGTLPGHPEEGEELFLVRRTPEGTTEFDLTVYARPVALLARAVAPLTREIQRVVTRGYLRALQRYTAEPTDEGS